MLIPPGGFMTDGSSESFRESGNLPNRPTRYISPYQWGDGASGSFLEEHRTGGGADGG